MNGMQLETYLANGVENTVKEILRASLKNPKESAVMLKYAAHSKLKHLLHPDMRDAFIVIFLTKRRISHR